MKKSRLTLLSFIVVLILACNLPAGTSTALPATQALPATAAEAAIVASDTPAPLPAPSLIPSPSVPQASPSSQAVNCRSGPGLGWGVLTLIQYGQSVEIVGKIADGTWLQVKPAVLGGNFCWVSAGVMSVTGNLAGVQIAAAPLAPTPLPTSLTTSVGLSVTSVSVSLSKDTISVAGCVGPVQPLTIYATIWVNGPMTLHWHFKTQQTGDLGTHVLKLSNATGKDVSDSFTPPVTAGKYWVELIIDEADLSGMDASATYKIKC